MTDRQTGAVGITVDLKRTVNPDRQTGGVGLNVDLGRTGLPQRQTGSVAASVDLGRTGLPQRQTGSLGANVDLFRMPGWVGVPISGQFRRTSSRSVPATAYFLQPGRVYENRVQAEAGLYAFYKLQENTATTVYSFSNAAGSPTVSALGGNSYYNLTVQQAPAVASTGVFSLVGIPTWSGTWEIYGSGGTLAENVWKGTVTAGQPFAPVSYYAVPANCQCEVVFRRSDGANAGATFFDGQQFSLQFNATGATAADALGSRNGTYTSRYILGAPGPGLATKAVKWEGGGYVVTPSAGSLISTWSFETWLQTTTLAAQVVAGARGTEFGSDIQATSAGRIHCDIGSGGGWIVTNADQPSGSIADGAWHHVVLAVTTTGWTLYVDAVAVNSGTYAATPVLFDPSHLLLLAWHNKGGDNPAWTGALAYTALYSVALSPTQVQAHYAAMTGSQYERSIPVTVALGQPTVRQIPVQAAFPLGRVIPVQASFSGVGYTSSLGINLSSLAQWMVAGLHAGQFTRAVPAQASFSSISVLRTTQASVEVLASLPPPLRTTQAAVEALTVTAAPNVQTTQAAIEVLTGASTAIPVRTTQAAIEVLLPRSARFVPALAALTLRPNRTIPAQAYFDLPRLRGVAARAMFFENTSSLGIRPSRLGAGLALGVSSQMGLIVRERAVPVSASFFYLTNARVTQAVLDVVVVAAGARVTQTAVEVILTAPGARVTQSVVEVVWKAPPPRLVPANAIIRATLSRSVPVSASFSQGRLIPATVRVRRTNTRTVPVNGQFYIFARYVPVKATFTVPHERQMGAFGAMADVVVASADQIGGLAAQVDVVVPSMAQIGALGAMVDVFVAQALGRTIPFSGVFRLDRSIPVTANFTAYVAPPAWYPTQLLGGTNILDTATLVFPSTIRDTQAAILETADLTAAAQVPTAMRPWYLSPTYQREVPASAVFVAHDRYVPFSASFGAPQLLGALYLTVDYALPLTDPSRQTGMVGITLDMQPGGQRVRTVPVNAFFSPKPRSVPAYVVVQTRSQRVVPVTARLMRPAERVVPATARLASLPRIVPASAVFYRRQQRVVPVEACFSEHRQRVVPCSAQIGAAPQRVVPCRAIFGGTKVERTITNVRARFRKSYSQLLPADAVLARLQRVVPATASFRENKRLVPVQAEFFIRQSVVPTQAVLRYSGFSIPAEVVLSSPTNIIKPVQAVLGETEPSDVLQDYTYIPGSGGHGSGYIYYNGTIPVWGSVYWPGAPPRITCNVVSSPGDAGRYDFAWRSWGSNTYNQLAYTQNNGMITAPVHTEARRRYHRVYAGTEFALGMSQGRLYHWGTGRYGQRSENLVADGFLEPRTIFTYADPPPPEGTTTPYIAMPPVQQAGCGSGHCVALDVNGKVWIWGRSELNQTGFGSRETPNGDSSSGGMQVRNCQNLVGTTTTGSYDLNLVRFTGSQAVLPFSVDPAGQMTITSAPWPATPDTPFSDWSVSGNILSFSPAITAYTNFHIVYNNPDAVTDLDRFIYAQLYAKMVPGIPDARFVSCGEYFTVVVGQDNSVWAAGAIPGASQSIGWTQVPHGISERILRVRGGRRHATLVTESGRLYAWGGNDLGQLGIGGTGDRTSPVFVTDGVADASPIADSTLVLKLDGTVWACGDNTDGQCGQGLFSEAFHSLVQVNVPPVEAIGYGCMSHTAMVVLQKSTNPDADDAESEIWGWGRNNAYQLQTGGTGSVASPVHVGGQRGITQIELGPDAVYASDEDFRDVDMTLEHWRTWGRWDTGALGAGRAFNQYTAALPPPAEGEEVDPNQHWIDTHTEPGPMVLAFSQVYAGFYVVRGRVDGGMALDRLGRVHNWGIDDQGQLGTGAESFIYSPYWRIGAWSSVPVPNIETAWMGWGWDQQNFIRLFEGDIMAWGNNDQYQLGFGHNHGDAWVGNPRITIPTSVPSLYGADVQKIVGNATLSIALLYDGRMLVAGTDYEGLVGDPGAVYTEFTLIQ